MLTPLTKPQALDKFCIDQRYDELKQIGETKAQFYQRRVLEQGKIWALSRVVCQVESEKLAEKQELLTGLDL